MFAPDAGRMTLTTLLMAWLFILALHIWCSFDLVPVAMFGSRGTLMPCYHSYGCWIVRELKSAVGNVCMLHSSGLLRANMCLALGAADHASSICHDPEPDLPPLSVWIGGCQDRADSFAGAPAWH